MLKRVGEFQTVRNYPTPSANRADGLYEKLALVETQLVPLNQALRVLFGA